MGGAPRAGTIALVLLIMVKFPYIGRARPLISLGVALCALAAIPLLSAPLVSASSGLGSQISSLQQHETQLQQQLDQLKSQASSAGQQAEQTAQEVSQLRQKLALASSQLAQANSALAITSDRLAKTRHQLSQDRSQLSQLVLALYQHNQGNDLGAAIVDSAGVSQFVDNSIELQTMGQQFSVLTRQMSQDRDSLQLLKSRQLQQQRSVAMEVMSLQTTQSSLQAEQQAYASQASSLSGQALGIASQLQQTSGQVAQLEAEEAQADSYPVGPAGEASLQYGTVLRVIGYQHTSAIPDDFTPGQCTWYVASQRPVPWSGNANQWAAAAALAGYPVTMTPQVGSVVVFAAGGLYDPEYGHVAYVVSVQGPSEFTVDEANFFDIPFLVDQRQIDSLSGVEGFIGS